nr:metal-dependent hydrolase [uncultured Nevskia sp.]
MIPRKVKFDWSNTSVDWIPGNPFASHFINEINLLLPAGEFWFCRLYNQALPLVRDAKLRDNGRCSSVRRRCMPGRMAARSLNI